MDIPKTFPFSLVFVWWMSVNCDLLRDDLTNCVLLREWLFTYRTWTDGSSKPNVSHTLELSGDQKASRHFSLFNVTWCTIMKRKVIYSNLWRLLLLQWLYVYLLLHQVISGKQRSSLFVSFIFHSFDLHSKVQFF